MCFKHKKQQIQPVGDPVEQRFGSMIELVKDLSKADYNRLKKGMDLGWQSYQIVRNVKTEDEKEVGDINIIENKLLDEQLVENSTKK